MRLNGLWFRVAISGAQCAASLLAILLVSCSKTTSQPELEYMPDMVRTPSIKTQRVNPTVPAYNAVRVPVVGTIPREYDPYYFATADTVGPARQLHNPLLPTMTVLQTGRKYFNSYCIVCHGYKGDGQGYIVPRFPAPPSLLTEKIKNWEDGRIFHIITRGRGNMPGYTSQLDPEKRWAIVHYVRALYRAAHPTPQDLILVKEQNLELLFSEDQPDTTTKTLWPKK